MPRRTSPVPRPGFLPALALAAGLVGCHGGPTPIEALQREQIPFPPTVRRAEPPPPSPAPARAPWQRIGTSVRGKAIEAAQFDGGSRRIYIIGGMRGDENEAPRAAEHAANLLAAPGLAMERGLAGATIRIVRDMNPDGTALNSRTNTRGVDLTRNWPAESFEASPRHGRAPASELETAAVHRDMQAFKPDVVIVLASSTRGPRVLFADALDAGRETAGASAGGQRALQTRGPARGPALAGRGMVVAFASGARRHDPRWRAIPDRTAIAPGSVEALVAGDWGKPVLTIEFQRGRSEAINARALLAGIESALAPGGAADERRAAEGR